MTDSPGSIEGHAAREDASETDAFLTEICDHTCDIIMDHADRVTGEMVARVMTMFRAIDPTESTHAAHIRDTIRDNLDTECHCTCQCDDAACTQTEHLTCTWHILNAPYEGN